MLTWFRNCWPDPRIKEREEELRSMVERHEASIKEWGRKFAQVTESRDRLLAMEPEQRPVYIDKIIASPELVEANRVLKKKLELALERLQATEEDL